MKRPSPPLSIILVAAFAGFCSSALAQSSPAAVDADLVSLEKFEVIGTRPETADNTAFKLPGTLLDTPRSVTVFDASRLREQDIQTGGDLLFWVPGLNTNGAVQESYHFYARGYRMGPNDWRVDGFAGRVVGSSYNPNLFGVEQVSVLKGPSGLLYGSASLPGGMINLVSKKPSDVAATTVETRVRTFGGGEVGFGQRVSHEMELDTTGPLTRDGRLLYRALASVERNAFAARSPADDNQFYRIALSYKLDQVGRFLVTPMFEWSREDRAQRHPSISPASSRAIDDGRTDYTFADASPRTVNLAGGGRLDTNRGFGAGFAAQLTPNWTASAGFRFLDHDYINDAFALNTATLRQSVADDSQSWTVSRRHSRVANNYKTASFDASTRYEFTPAERVKSLLQVGLNGRRNDNTTASSGNGPDQSPINIYTGVAATPLIANAPPLAIGNATENFVWNAYAQSQTEFASRWVFTAGFGHARETNETTSPAGIVTKSPARSSDLTPNAALVYKLSRSVSLYTSYSSSPCAARPDARGRTGAPRRFLADAGR